MKTWLRILGAAAVAAFGVAAMVFDSKNAIWVGIGTSLAAGAVANLISTASMYYDDKGAASLHSLVERIAKLQQGISAEILNLAREVADLHRCRVVSKRAEDRCILRRTPKTEFERELDRVKADTPLQIDVMGLTLDRFYREQLGRLIERPQVTIRLIVQYPGTSLFKQIARQEQRDANSMKAETHQLTRHVIELQGSATTTARCPARIEIRWFDGCPSVTLTRVNDVVFVRPRFLGETNEDALIFFEQYQSSDGPCFEAYSGYFEEAWRSSKPPQLDHA